MFLFHPLRPQVLFFFVTNLILPSHDSGDGPPILFVGEVVFEHGGLEPSVEVGVLPGHVLVLPQGILVRGRTFQGLGETKYNNTSVMAILILKRRNECFCLVT